MNLVNKVKENFPGLETGQALKEHRNTVLEFIRKESAICAQSDGNIVGALLFARDSNMLCFLAVDPKCRRQHIAEEMVSEMLPFLNPQKDVVVTTYREGVPEGPGGRASHYHPQHPDSGIPACGQDPHHGGRPDRENGRGGAGGGD